DEGLQDMIRQELIVRKKGEALDGRLSLLLKQKNGDLEAVAAAFGGVQVIDADTVRFKEQAVPVYGNDIRLIEAIIGMEPGTVSKPVAVKGGRALIVLRGKAYPDTADLESEKARLLPMLEKVKQERFIQDYFTAERRAATIEDM
nr:peptidyl-prolyl cis-trans isomerase [Chlorobium phaeobacteroides]